MSGCQDLLNLAKEYSGEYLSCMKWAGRETAMFLIFSQFQGFAMCHDPSQSFEM